MTGDLSNFSVNPFDAIMEPAKGRSTFKVRVYDTQGSMNFEKSYKGYSEYRIGFTCASGSRKSIEKTLDASVNELFEDREFIGFLNEL